MFDDQVADPMILWHENLLLTYVLRSKQEFGHFEFFNNFLEPACGISRHRLLLL